MDDWLQLISGPGADLQAMKASKAYEWREADLRLMEGDLQAKTDESRPRASNPLKNVDVMRPGLHVWRVKDTLLEPWRQECYGHFYDTECYIVLQIKSTQDQNKPLWNLHLWVGKWVLKESYRMALFKTAELNSVLNYQGAIYREPQGRETAAFRESFLYTTYFRGGAHTSYWSCRLRSDQYTPRLLRVDRPNPRLSQYRVTEVPARSTELDSSYVYILDTGDQLFQWNGELCQTDDVISAARYVQYLKATRGVRTKVKCMNDQDQDQENHPFYMYLSGSSYMTLGRPDDDNERPLSHNSSKRHSHAGPRGQIFRVTTNHAKGLHYKKIKDGGITMKDLAKETLCVLDLGHVALLMANQRAAADDHIRSIEIMHKYTQTTNRPLAAFIIPSDVRASQIISQALSVR